MVFFKAVVDRRFVTLADIRSVARASRYKTPIKRMLVREVQRFLRMGLGLDLIAHVSEPVADKKGRKKPSYDLDERRNWKRMSVAARPTLDGVLAARDASGKATTRDTDAVVSSRASGNENLKRAVCFTALCLVAAAPRQLLPEETLMNHLQAVDSNIEESLGADWKASVKRWVREQDILGATTETVTKHSGERESTVMFSIAGGGRSLIGAPAAMDLMLQITGSAGVDDKTFKKWLGKERIDVDSAAAREAEDDDDDEDGNDSTSRPRSAGHGHDDDEDDNGGGGEEPQAAADVDDAEAATASKRGRAKKPRPSRSGKRGKVAQ